MPDVTLTIVDAVSASSGEVPSLTELECFSAPLSLIVLEVGGVADIGSLLDGVALTLPVPDVVGRVSDIGFDLELPHPTISATFGDLSTGTLSLPAITLEGTGLNGSAADGALTLPCLAVDCQSGIDSGLALPLVEAAGEILTGLLATGDVRLPQLEVEAVIFAPLYTDGTLFLPVLTVAGLASEQDIPVGVLTFPLLQVRGTILNGLLATGALTIPAPQISATGIVSTEATGALTLPLLQIAGIVDASVVLVEPDGTTTTLSGYALVLSLDREGAVTEYTNFAFNSFTEFNGEYLAANSSGIYELAGETDAGDYIESIFRTPMQDGNTNLLKRPEDVYIGAMSDDDLQVSVLTDGNIEYDGSIITGKSVDISTRKSKLGKGIKSRYWAVQIENMNGCDFRVESAELVLKTVERKLP